MRARLPAWCFFKHKRLWGPYFRGRRNDKYTEPVDRQQFFLNAFRKLACGCHGRPTIDWKISRLYSTSSGSASAPVRHHADPLPRGCIPRRCRLKSVGIGRPAEFRPGWRNSETRTIVCGKFFERFWAQKLVPCHVAELGWHTSPCTRTSEWRVDIFDPHLYWLANLLEPDIVQSERREAEPDSQRS